MQTQAVLTFWLEANLKNLGAIPMRNLEFRKKKCYFVNKRLFLTLFSEV